MPPIEITPEARRIWEKYKPAFSILETQHLINYFLELCEKLGIDPYTLDFDEEVVDWALTYWENKTLISEFVTKSAAVPREEFDLIGYLLEEAGKMLRETDYEVVESKTLEGLERAAERLKKYRIKEEELKREIERLKRRYDVKYVEKEREAKEVKPPPVFVPPPVEKGLRKADEEELRTEFRAELLKKTISPRKWMPIFEDELIKWRREYAEFPRDVARTEVKTDLLRLIPDVVGLAKPPKIKPVKEVVRRIPDRVPTRIEIGVERVPAIVTRRCWVCDESFEADRDLERRVREAITTVRGPRDVIYQEPLLGFRMLFYYLCEEHRNEKFGFRDIYDALAFQLAEARSSGYKKLTLTKEVLRDRGFTPEDLREIQVRVTRWLPPSPSE